MRSMDARGNHVAIRDETPADHAAGERVLRQAFHGGDEANLVRALRNGGHVVISLVAEANEVMGHIVFSRLRIESATASVDGLAMAPLAVDPAFQRRGIGSAMVRAGLERAKSLGERIVFVLGDPAYYGRFGFSAETAKSFECVYACEAFQALLLGDALPGVMVGRVVYAPPFDALGGGEHS
jgi:putative acetyltransferase